MRETLTVAAAVILGAAASAQAQVTLLNVSYDPTRELYEDFNAAFAKYWKAKTGQDVTVQQSHGGSGKQARAVIDGLEADVVTLALAYDIDAIAEKAACSPPDWQKRLPQQQRALHLDHRLPGAQGQPQGHQGLGRPGQARRLGHHAQPEDLRRRALELPGRLGLCAAADRAATRPKAQRVRRRSSSRTCRCSTPAPAARPPPSSQRGIGDVLLAWENEAFLAVKELGTDKFEIVVPSRQHPGRAAGGRGRQGRGQARHAQGGRGLPGVPVLRRGPGHRRQALLPPALDVGGRPSTPASFPKLKLFTIDEVFGGWQKAQKTHFADGGVFDQIYQPGSELTRGTAQRREHQRDSS